jgi:hypothetical protein
MCNQRRDQPFFPLNGVKSMQESESINTSPIPRGLCLGCGYDLRGIQARKCPECGRGFDPDDPWTMKVRRPPPRWAMRLGGRTRWISSASIPLTGILILGNALFISTLELLWWFFIFWMVVATPYLLRAAFRWLLIIHWRQPREILNADSAARKHIAIVFLVSGVLLYFEIAPMLTFWIGRYWLESHAATICRNYGSFQPPGDLRFYGLLPAKPVRALKIEVDFEVGFGAVTYLPFQLEDSFDWTHGMDRHHWGHWNVDFGGDPMGAWKILDLLQGVVFGPHLNR